MKKLYNKGTTLCAYTRHGKYIDLRQSYPPEWIWDTTYWSPVTRLNGNAALVTHFCVRKSSTLQPWLLTTRYLTLTTLFLLQRQGHIEPPKVARGYATYIDSKMLSVTKYSFQIYFWLHTYNDASAIAYHIAWMADIPSAAFVFDEDLACQLEIEDLSDTEGILMP